MSKLKKIIKVKIEKNDIMAYYFKVLRNTTDKNFISWVKDYRSPNIIQYYHYGDLNKDKSIYCIDFKDNNLGFFGLWKQMLHRISYAEYFGLTPVVFWGPNTLYYESKLSDNAFENYFLPVSNVEFDEVSKSARVVQARTYDQEVNFTDSGYGLDKDQLNRYVQLQMKYIHIKPELEEILKREIERVLGKKKTLAVHIRGVEWGNIANHPVPIGLDKYTTLIDQAVSEYHFEQVFVATDSEDTFNEMNRIYEGKIVFFDDVARAKVGSHTLAIFDPDNDNIPMKHYQMGYEVLRDMMALAMSDGLIAGYSNISLAANVWKLADGKEYSYQHIMQNKINKSGISVKKAVKKMRQGKK